MKRAWSEDVVEVYPNCFEPWSKLPNELKAFVIQNMDARTAADLMNSGRIECELARKYVRNVVDIRVEYRKAEENDVEKMFIELKDAKSGTIQLTWCLIAEPVRSTRVIYTSAKPQTLTLAKKTVGTTTSMILRRLLTEPMFIVKKLEFQLEKYTRKINLGSIEANIECLVFNRCFYQCHATPILKHKTLKYKAAMGVTYRDFEYIWNFGSFGAPRSILADVLHRYYQKDMSELLYSLQQSPPNTFEKVVEFFDLTISAYWFLDLDEADDKLELLKTTNDIMYFRAAYYYQPNSVPYLQNSDDRFNEKIAFLKDGIDGYLSDYQLSILSIAYLVRLYRYEPEIAEIEEKALRDLEDMSRKQGSLDCYNKFVSKIEALLPLP